MGPRAVSVTYTGTGGVILSSGNPWDMATQTESGAGLTAYDVNGAQRFHLFGDEVVRVQELAGRYAYVVDTTLTRFQIIDTMTGKIVGTATTKRPTILAASRTTY